MGDCKTCTGCKEKKTKAEEPLTIPYSAYQMAQANNRKNIKYIIIALIVAIALMFASNAIWLYAWCQYDYTGEETLVTVDSEDGGNANYIGSDGDIINGSSSSPNSVEDTN